MEKVSTRYCTIFFLLNQVSRCLLRTASTYLLACLFSFFCFSHLILSLLCFRRL